MDDEDYPLVKALTWQWTGPKKPKNPPFGGGFSTWITLPRLLLLQALIEALSRDPNSRVEHINGDILDNRRSNLRIVSSSEMQKTRWRVRAERKLREGMKCSAPRCNKKARKRINRIPYGLLRTTLEHKAPQMGVDVIEVNPAYTSQTCPKCGHRAKANRKRRLFLCRQCGFTANADRVASVNIGLRAITSPVAVAKLYGATGQISQVGASFNRLDRQDEAHSWSHPEMSQVAS